jgi:hypothetical protein
LFCFLNRPFPAQPGFVSTSPVIPISISFFAFDIRCPCSPTCFFVPSLGLFYRRSTLLFFHLD